MDPRERDRRIYRRMLGILPSDLRVRFGRDMEDALLHRLDGAGRSRLRRLAVWTLAGADVAAQAVVARRSRTTDGPRHRSRLDATLHDVRYAARSLRASPLLTLAALATLTLGIGAATATFSVVHAVYLRALPFESPERLVVVWPEQNANQAMTRLAEESMRSLESVSGLSPWTLTLTGSGDPLEIVGTQASHHHFDVLGVRPLLGRAFQPEEALPGRAGVAILAHDFWMRAFGGDPDVVGRTLDIGGAEYDRRTVIGVMPEGVDGIAQKTDLWIPLEGDPGLGLEDDDSWYVNVRVGRLAAGATREQAAAEVSTYAATVQRRLPGVITEEDALAATVQPLRDFTAGDVGGVLWVALGAVTLVLLIACANVANLLLARGEARARDVDVRSALGAGRARIVTMHLAEVGLLTGMGGGLGVLASYGLVRMLVTQAPTDFPALGAIGVNGPVLVYALGATVTAIVVGGLAPALRAGRMPGSAGLVGSGRGTGRTRGGRLSPVLIGAQIAMAVLVIVASGLMLRSLSSLLAVDPGLDGRGVLTLRPTPPAGTYPDGPAFRDYYRSVTERLAALPAVESVGAIHLLPGTSNNWSFPTYPEGVEPAAGSAVPSVNFRAVRSAYFETLRVPLVAGRYLTDADGEDAEPVGVVNRAFVERFWPGEEPLGRSVRLFSSDGVGYRIVGVVADVRQHARRQEPRPEMYFSHEQVPWDQMSFWMMVRVGSGEPLEHARSVQEAVWSVDAAVPISGVADMEAVLGESTRETRFIALLLSAFGALALVLGAVGVFGVTAYTAGRRRAEFGVRLALGSTRMQVLGAAVRGSVVAVVVGLGVGLLAAALLADVLSSVLYRVEPGDPATFVGVAALLGGIATLAALAPAWSACRLDLVRVLTDE